MRRSMLVIACFLAAVFTGLVLSGLAEASPGRGKSAAKDLLPAALRNVDIKDNFVPGEGKEAGVIQAITGHMVVARQDLRQAYYAAVGDQLYEKDVLFTLKSSRCRFRMHNEDVVTLGEAARVMITAFVDNRDTQEKRSSFGMTKGKAMFYTLRLLKHKQAGMDVTTPTAVAGVRGTKFGVDIVEIDESTNVYAYEGAVTVMATATGQTTTLHEGQGVNASAVGLGDTFTTPPGVSQQFQLDTIIETSGTIGLGIQGSAAGKTEPGSAGMGSASTATKKDESAADTTTSGPTGMRTASTVPTDTSSITQQQTIKKTEDNTDHSTSPPFVPTPPPAAIDPIIDPGTNASGTYVGYFSGMLTNSSSPKPEEIFVSTKRQDFAGQTWARGSTSPSTDYIRVDAGNSGMNPYLKWVVFGSGLKNSGDLQSSHPVSTSLLGSNADMSWAYWTMPNAFAVGGSNYVVDNRGYLIYGANTPSMSGFSGTAAYSGTAYGTYWTSAGGVNMTGPFGCNVNFGTAAISNFGLNVSTGGTSASISGASGAFANDASFNISGGTWNLNGSTPDLKNAYGSFYGSDAKSIGGAWGMYNTSLNTGATGIFSGTGTAIDPITDPGTNASGRYTGYGAGMLTNATDSKLEEVFVSTTRQDFSSNVWVRGSKSPSMDYVRGIGTLHDGNSPPSPYDGFMKWVVFDSGTGNSGDLGSTVTQKYTDLGQYNNANMKWGYNTFPSGGSFTANGCSYAFDNKVYSVIGQNTPSMTGLTGLAVYSGPAYGTYWTSTGGINMVGTFGCDVNLGTAAISNFGLSMSGGGKSAFINNASGSIGSDAHFQVTGGAWNLNGATPDHQHAYGSLYGSSANAIGGSWGMFHVASNTGAAGIYQGDQKTRPLTHFGYAPAVISEYWAPFTPERSFPHHYYVSLTNFDPSYSSESSGPASTTMTIQGLASGSATLTNLIIRHSSPPETLVINTGLPAPVSHVELGHDPYTEWGSWMQPNAMSNDARTTIYRFDNTNYYIWGDPTPNNQIAALSANNVTGIYSGVSYGTYTSASGPAVTADMSGSFSTTINFGSKTVSNFNINVSGGGHNVTITGASGTFPGVDSQFAVNPSSGQWRLDGVPPFSTYNGAHGSVFGSNGQAVGGQWIIVTGSDSGPSATGIFQGRR